MVCLLSRLRRRAGRVPTPGHIASKIGRRGGQVVTGQLSGRWAFSGFWSAHGGAWSLRFSWAVRDRVVGSAPRGRAGRELAFRGLRARPRDSGAEARRAGGAPRPQGPQPARAATESSPGRGVPRGDPRRALAGHDRRGLKPAVAGLGPAPGDWRRAPRPLPADGAPLRLRVLRRGGGWWAGRATRRSDAPRLVWGEQAFPWGRGECRRPRSRGCRLSRRPQRVSPVTRGSSVDGAAGHPGGPAEQERHLAQRRAGARRRELRDGDEIRLGSVQLLFRARSLGHATVTVPE